jgi:hypothetical protein
MAVMPIGLPFTSLPTGNDLIARLKVILDGRHATVLLVSSISRLSRQS